MAHAFPAARRRIALDAALIVGDAHKYALKKSTYTPNQADFNAADGHECTATNYPSGGNAVSGLVNATGTNKAFGDMADPSFANLTGAFQWGVLYRTSDGKVVLEQDLGAQNVTAMTVTVTQPAAAEGTAMLNI